MTVAHFPSVLALAHDCMKAGSRGIIFGRNVWLHPKMERLINAICAIVHEETTVESARNLLR